jgi:hypothetical protein
MAFKMTTLSNIYNPTRKLVDAFLTVLLIRLDDVLDYSSALLTSKIASGRLAGHPSYSELNWHTTLEQRLRFKCIS